MSPSGFTLAGCLRLPGYGMDFWSWPGVQSRLSSPQLWGCFSGNVTGLRRGSGGLSQLHSWSWQIWRMQCATRGQHGAAGAQPLCTLPLILRPGQAHDLSA